MMTDETRAEYPRHFILDPDFDPAKKMTKLKRVNKRTNVTTESDYLGVQDRLLWFLRDQREMIVKGLAQMPYIIKTDIVEHAPKGGPDSLGWANFCTYIRDVIGNEVTMFGSESHADFSDYLEKASTKSVGRALLFMGYGTAFAQLELDEGERLADTPRPAAARNTRQNSAPAAGTSQPGNDTKPTGDQLEDFAKLRAALKWTTKEPETQTAMAKVLASMRREYDARVKRGEIDPTQPVSFEKSAPPADTDTPAPANEASATPEQLAEIEALANELDLDPETGTIDSYKTAQERLDGLKRLKAILSEKNEAKRQAAQTSAPAADDANDLEPLPHQLTALAQLYGPQMLNRPYEPPKTRGEAERMKRAAQAEIRASNAKKAS